jgi:hypothetical protein
VKPGGDLVNTVAEIGIHAINPKGRGALKRIMPVRLSVSIFLSQPKATIFLFFLPKCQNKMNEIKYDMKCRLCYDAIYDDSSFFTHAMRNFFLFLTSVKYDQNILKFSSLVICQQDVDSFAAKLFFGFFVLVKYDEKVLKTVFA